MAIMRLKMPTDPAFKRAVALGVLGYRPRVCSCGASLEGRAPNATRCLDCAGGQRQGPRVKTYRERAPRTPVAP